MEGIHLPFDFEGKFSNSPTQFLQNKWKHQFPFVGTEPTSVLDNISSPSPPTSTAAGGNTDTAGLSVTSNHPSVLPQSWESETLLPNSMLKWITGDAEDPSISLNNFSDGGFDSANQAPGSDPIALLGLGNGNFPNPSHNPLSSPVLHSNHHLPFADVKPQIYDQQMQNPGLFFPVGSTRVGEVFMPPQQLKRRNYGDHEPVFRFIDSGQPVEVLSVNLADELYKATEPVQTGNLVQVSVNLADELYKAADSVQTGNLVHGQEILARLNHQLPAPSGKPFHRAAFYFKEALQKLFFHRHDNMMTSPFTLIYEIDAYKSLSEISPVIQFANFTCNQAILESIGGYNHIHIIDFGVGFGFGDQWASLMQELALRKAGPPSLKITVFTSASMIDELELNLTRENLIQLAREINMPFEFEVMGIDVILNSPSAWSLLFRSDNINAIAVNLPSGSYFALTSVLRFIKQISPKIVISVDRGSDRTDLSFPNHLTHALHCHANLLESLDASNLNKEVLEKIERFVIQPGVEKIITERFRCLEKTQHWRTAFSSMGFSPLIFSSYSELQAECLVKRTNVRGFHIEKRLGSLVLCWQRKELVSVSAWRC